MNQLVVILLALGAGYFLVRIYRISRPAVSPEEARTAIDAGTAVLVDVREPAEWRAGVAAPAVLLPLSDLRGKRQSWAPFLEVQRGKRILLYCHQGTRSGMAASLLRKEGFDAANLGGFSRWLKHGLPVRQL